MYKRQEEERGREEEEKKKKKKNNNNKKKVEVVMILNWCIATDSGSVANRTQRKTYPNSMQHDTHCCSYCWPIKRRRRMGSLLGKINTL